MERQFHIIVLAWKRYQYTFRTLDSLFLHNDLSRFRLWYGLDAGHHPLLPRLLEDFGCTCCFRPSRPQGIAGMFRGALAGLNITEPPRRRPHVGPFPEVSDGDLVLVLENDWVCVRPIPVDLIRHVLDHSTIGAFWLFRRDHLRMGRNGRLGGPPIRWHGAEVLGETIQVGRAFWGHPPTVSTVGTAWRLADGARTGADSRLRSVDEGIRVAWQPDAPVFQHIGKLSYKQLGGKR